VSAGALAHPAKVDPECHQTGVIQSGRCAKHNLIVHRAAPERMWMQNQRHPAIRLLARWLYDGFEAPVWNFNKEISCRIHIETGLCSVTFRTAVSA
jgi:hypothetical protein